MTKRNKPLEDFQRRVIFLTKSFEEGHITLLEMNEVLEKEILNSSVVNNLKNILLNTSNSHYSYH